MLRISTNALAPVETLRADMDQVLADLFGTSRGRFDLGGRHGNPPLDIWEQDESVYLEASVPGIAEDEIEITALGRKVTLSGTPKTEVADDRSETAEDQPAAATEPSSRTYYARERCVRAFRREVEFPFDIDAEKIDANLDHGLLRVVIPKAPSARPRKISVQVK